MPLTLRRALPAPTEDAAMPLRAARLQMGGGRVDRLDRDRRVGAAELADLGRDVRGRQRSVRARQQVGDEPVHLLGERDAAVDQLEPFVSIDRQEVRRAELRERQRAQPLEPMDVVVDVVVERRVHALPARGADAVDLNHVAAEEQARRPLEQRAVAPGVSAGEHDLELAVAELERFAVAQDAVDGKVAAAHRHDPFSLGVE